MAKCKTPCPNKCKENNEIQMILRKDLEKHLTEQCMNRDYKCQHCGKKDTFANITGIHDDTCEKKVLPCPNADCPDSMQRAKIKQHLENDCEYAVISCKYEGIGCDVKIKRKDMGAHEQDDKAHLHQALTTVVNENTSMNKAEFKTVQDRLQSATETITSMQKKLKSALFKSLTMRRKIKIKCFPHNHSILALMDTTCALRYTPMGWVMVKVHMCQYLYTYLKVTMMIT